MDHLKLLIREVPIFRNRVSIFSISRPFLRIKKDFTTRLRLFGRNIRASLSTSWRELSPWLFFCPAVALALNTGFIPIRKPGKLPWQRCGVDYELEYGMDRLEVHADAIEPGQRVLIIDDVLATGGTASAVAKLVEQVGGKVAGLGFVIELTFLPGRSKLDGYNLFSLLKY